MKIQLITLASACLIAFAANSSVTYDDEGVGFVGKGDVQSLFGWNNQGLQENAHALQFQMIIPSGATWKCAGYNPSGNWVEQSKGSESQPLASDISVDARKNRNGVVTGFMLNGIDYDSAPSYAGVGECEPPNSRWSDYGLVLGSIQYGSEDAEIMLQVSVDGIEWYDLPITE